MRLPELLAGSFLGAAGRGCISSAVRADLASAAATVLATHSVQSGAAYELAGDAYTLAELATEISRQSGNPVVYRDLEEAAYKAVPTSAGLAEDFAQLFAEADAEAALGPLFGERRQLSRLIGRPTTTMAHSVAAALFARSSP